MDHQGQHHRGLATRFAPLGLSALLVLLSLGTAWADAPEGLNNSDQVCRAPVSKQDKFKQLRALSLELRGHPPTPKEYKELQEQDRVPDALIDAWLGDQKFAQRVVRWHKGMFWNNLTNQNLTNASASLGVSRGLYWRVGTPAVRQRGIRVPCLDEPAEFDSSGNPVMKPQPDGSRREGYVMVNPFWAPKTEIKVCALDARENMLSEGGVPCAQNASAADVSCGCGPNLRWCSTGQTRRDWQLAFEKQMDLTIEDVILSGLPYTEVFTTREGFMNGPLEFYWTHQYQRGGTLQNQPAPYTSSSMPGLEYEDKETWKKVDLGKHHAGILTSPGFLLRFQTNRARANQFFTKMLCQPFQPPPNGIETDEEAGRDVLDLQKRDGCKYCHATLEPASSFWGRWRERSAGYFKPQTYPTFSNTCDTCAKTGVGCTNECRRYYITDTSDAQMMPYSGYLTSYLWLDEKHQAHVEQGPALLAKRTVADNRMPKCVVRTSMERLYGRSITQKEEQEVLPEVIRQFASSNYNYAQMIKAIVSSPSYRSVR